MQDIMEQSTKLFIPLGTQNFQFNRLVESLNDMVAKGFFQKNELMLQSSVIDIEPIFKYVKVLPYKDFNTYIDNADVIITHSGVNSIMTCMNKKKPLVIVPRQKKYGEHIDDHQMEIADLMECKFNVIVVRDIGDLPGAIEMAKRHEYKQWVSKRCELIEAIRRAIE